jgi:hypothetical protein
MFSMFRRFGPDRPKSPTPSREPADPFINCYVLFDKEVEQLRAGSVTIAMMPTDLLKYTIGQETAVVEFPSATPSERIVHNVRVIDIQPPQPLLRDPNAATKDGQAEFTTSQLNGARYGKVVFEKI